MTFNIEMLKGEKETFSLDETITTIICDICNKTDFADYTTDHPEVPEGWFSINIRTKELTQHACSFSCRDKFEIG